MNDFGLASNADKREQFMLMITETSKIFPKLVTMDIISAFEMATMIVFGEGTPSDDEWKIVRDKLSRVQKHMDEYMSKNYIKGLCCPRSDNHIYFVIKRRDIIINCWTNGNVINMIKNAEYESDDKYYDKMVNLGWYPVSFDTLYHMVPGILEELWVSDLV